MKKLIIFLILEIISIEKELYIYIDEQNIIDTFQGFGVILEANITHHSQNANLCQIIKQRLENQMINEILLVPQINESIFNQFYNDGSFQYQGNYYYIVQMVPIINGTVILLSNGNLIYIKENNNSIDKIESNYQIPIDSYQLLYPVYMFYLSTSHKIIIILNQQLIYVQLNTNEFNIFGEYTNEFDDKILTIQNILFIDDHLFIVVRNQLIIYSFNKEGFIESIYKNQFKMNFIDIQVQKENDQFNIFLLHRRLGVKICNYEINNKQFYDNSSFNDIPYQGYKIGLYKNILMIVNEQDNQSIIYELHLSKQYNKWNMLNKYKLQNIINDIHFTEYYAILIKNNGHDIIYHSLPSVDYQISNQIIIPKLQQIYLLNQTEPYNQSIIGFTKHTYFTSKFYIAPQKISCQYNKEPSPIQFTYYQNSTQCSQLLQQEEGKLYLYISNYTVLYKYPIITSEDKIYIWIIAIILSVFLVIFMVYRLYKYIKYRKNFRKGESIPLQSTINSTSISPMGNMIDVTKIFPNDKTEVPLEKNSDVTFNQSNNSMSQSQLQEQATFIQKDPK